MACEHILYVSERHAEESAKAGESPVHCESCGYWKLERKASKKSDQAEG